MGDVDWNLRLEWEHSSSEGWLDFAGVFTWPGDAQPSVLIYDNDNLDSLVLLSGTTGTEVLRKSLYGIGDVTIGDSIAGIPGVGEDPLFAGDMSHWSGYPSGWWLTAMEPGGTMVHWSSFNTFGESPRLFDIDQELDGRAEVASGGGVIEPNGGEYGVFPTDGDGQSCCGETLVADLDGDGRVEVGTVTGLWDGLTGEGQRWPEEVGYVYKLAAIQHGGEVRIVGEIAGAVVMLTPAGDIVWRHDLSATSAGFAVWARMAIGDVDGDGESEICFPETHGNEMWILSLDGEIERQWPRRFFNGGGCTLADLDADGDAEIIEFSTDGLAIRDGRSGVVLAADQDFQRTDLVGAPIVADIDGDGSAEILAIGHVPSDPLPGEPRLRVYGAASGRWARTRRAWLGELYDITSVDEQGTVISWPFPPWEHYNAYRAQPAHDGDHPDLVIEPLAACADTCEAGHPTSTVHLGYRISNLGSKEAAAGTVVRLYTRDHRMADPVWSEVQTVTLAEPVAPTWSLEGMWLDVAPEDWGTRHVLQVDGDLADECDRVNDRTEILLDPCSEVE